MRHLSIASVVIAACFCLASTSHADINIAWWSSSGAYAHGADYTNGPWPNPLGLRQLIWSSVDPTNLVPDLADVNYLDANSFLLFAYSTNVLADGAYWDPSYINDGAELVFSDADVGGNDINNGYLYSRIFQDPTPTNGMWYLQSDPTGPALPAYDPQNLNIIDYDSTPNDGNSTPFELNQQVIPEPATWAFMGLGVLAIVIRRLRK